MNELTMNLNWPAVLLGTLLAFVAGWLWYSPMLFQKVWAKGTHNIAPPESIPLAAMATQLFGTFLMAWLIGVTASANALATAILAILAIAALQVSGGLMGQKSQAAALVDGGYIVAMGVLMILAQGLL